MAVPIVTAKVVTFLNADTRAAIVLLNRNAQNDLSGTSTACGAAQATNTTGVKVVNSTPYWVDGTFKTAIAATDPFWTLAGTTAIVASGAVQVVKYLLCTGLAGAASVIQSTIAATAAGCVYPTSPASQAVFSVLTISVTAGNVFTPGTTSLTGTGVTATFADGTDPALFPQIGDANSGLPILNFTAGGLGPIGQTLASLLN
jgi:hypothetical protein